MLGQTLGPKKQVRFHPSSVGLRHPYCLQQQRREEEENAKQKDNEDKIICMQSWTRLVLDVFSYHFNIYTCLDWLCNDILAKIHGTKLRGI